MICDESRFQLTDDVPMIKRIMNELSGIEINGDICSRIESDTLKSVGFTS